MKNVIHYFTTILVLLTLGGNDVSAQSVDTFRFVNNTGRTVTDLHIEFYESGVELVEHNFPKEAGGGNIKHRSPRRNGSKTRHDFQNGALPNKGVVTISFNSDTSDTRIKQWFWTVDNNGPNTPYQGKYRKGMNEDDQSLDMDLVVPKDRIARLKLKQPYKKIKSNGEEGDFDVNDLHIVTTKRPSILNRTREKENEKPRPAGTFEKDEVIECKCSDLPKKEPCKSVCTDKNSKYRNETLYILKLATAQSIPAGTTIKLDLKGVTPADVAWHWWTKNGKPIRLDDKGPTVKKRDKNDGVAGSGPDAHDSDASPVKDWSHIAYLPNFGNSFATDAYFFVGLSTDLLSSPFKPADYFGQENMDRLNSSIYEDPALFEQLLVTLEGEFFIGNFSEAPRFDNITSDPQTGYGLNVAYGFANNFAVAARVNRFTARATANFPVILFDGQDGSSQQLSGRYALEQTGLQTSLGLQYFLGNGPLQAFGGAQVGLRSSEQTVQASIGEFNWLVEQNQSSSFGYGLVLGGRYLMGNGLFFDTRLSSAHFDQHSQWGSQATIGIRF